jgi:ferrous iron transport protein A
MPSTLASLAKGEEAVIVAIHANELLRNRLISLGFRLGQPVRLIRRGAFSGPLQVRLGGTDIIIRRQDAVHIQIARSEFL